MSARRRQLWSLPLLVALTSPAAVVGAQVKEEALKAAFIFNFASFTTFPAADDPLPASLEICSFADFALDDALRELEGKQVRGRSVTVRSLAYPQLPADCDVLVVDPRRLAESDLPARPGETAPVGGDTEQEWWVQAGTLTILSHEVGQDVPPRACIAMVREGGRIRFDVDSATASSVGIEFSSRLLGLARQIW